MGLATTRCVTVTELVHELRQCDGDMLVRFRDGDAVLPLVYVMKRDRTGHVDIGCPYSSRERLAEIDAAVRKVDGRPPKRGSAVWVLIRRYEWGTDAQQTKSCDTFVFTGRVAAVRKAASLLKADMRTFGRGFTPSEARKEGKAMAADLCSRFHRHTVRLSESDNVVYEMYRREVRK